MKVLNKQNLIVPIVIGVIATIGLALLLLGVATSMILNGKMSLQAETMIVVVVHFIAMFVGSLLSGMTGDKPLVSCAGTLVVVLLFNLVVTIFSFSGEFQSMLPCLLADIGGFATAFFLSTFLKNKKKSRIKKYRSR